MSRCFPFPPPGYEKKVRINDIDLLAKEKKHKEKKHKKDKKDKEKREHKEKKDKDRSKEKHGERKDRKEKHKDKNERDRDNGNTWATEKKRIEGQPESSNGQKHGPNGFHNVDIKDNKYVQELERRYRNDERATGSQVVQKIMVTDQRPLLSNQSRQKERIKDKKEDDRTVNGQRATGSQVVQKIMVTDQRPLLSNQSREQERIKEKKEDDRTVNAQRNHVEGKCAAEAFVQNFPRIDQRKLEGIARPIEKDVEKQIEGRDRKKNTDDDNKIHKPKERDKVKKVKSKDKDRDGKKEKKKMSKPSDVWSKLEGSGKDSLDAFSNKASNLLQVNSNNSAAGGNLGKRKEPEMNGSSHENGFLLHKLPRSVSSQPDVENGRKSEPSHTSFQFLSEAQVAANNSRADIKERRINGFRGSEPPNACSTRPSSSEVKVNENGGASANPPHPDSKNPSERVSIQNACSIRPSSSEVKVDENGGVPAKLPHPDFKNPSEILSIPNACSTKPSSSDVKVNENGGASAKPRRPDSKYPSEILSIPNASSTRPSSSNVKVNENGGASAKRPHPDSKYLIEILSIPKMEDESDLDDQEWLFRGNGSASKKPKVGTPEVEMTPQVWAEAMKIGSLDLYALPYVIPY